MRKSVPCIAAFAVSLILTTHSAAQTPDKGPTFEVASVKPAAPGAPGMSIQPRPGGGVMMTNATLRWMITMAWDIRDYQLVAPGWLDSEHFDIVAKPEIELPPTPEEFLMRMQMIRNLLVQRFGLVFHTEIRELPIYALVISKDGPKLAPAASAGPGGSSMGSGQLKGKGMQIINLAKDLSTALGRTVVDQTGLTGEYDYTLKWEPDTLNGASGGGNVPEPDNDLPSLFTAIQEQLGLKLESRKGPVEIMVIDKAERPSEN